MATQQQRVGGRWLTKWLFGMDFFPSDEHVLELLKAVLICARGDGVISDVERNFFVGYLDAVGSPDAAIALAKTYEGKESLETLLKDCKAVNENTKSVIIYNAVMVSAADGYAAGEHDSIVKMAGILGISPESVKHIEDQYFEDVKANEKREKVLFAAGHPWKNK